MFFILTCVHYSFLNLSIFKVVSVVFRFPKIQKIFSTKLESGLKCKILSRVESRHYFTALLLRLTRDRC